MDARKRHTLLWKVARPLGMLAAKIMFNYSSDICREEGPLLILPNHNADHDPLFVNYAFPEPVYFVGSEDILRGWAGGFMRWATDIIPRQKGGNASGTVRGIVRHLKDGHNVCLFAEGNRSWDGVTRPITPATAKMVRMSGAKLVTYRTEGLYLSSPRWSGSSIRRGKAHGTVVGVYEPEYLKSITATAIQELIDRDLYENAYERQRKKRVKFKGKRLAEQLETLLFMCPHCHSEGKMRSEGNYFICDECGTKLRYTEEGFFVGENCMYDTVLDWNIWQKEQIEAKCKSESSEPIFSDTELELYTVSTAKSESLLACGTMKMLHGSIELPDGSIIPVKDISGMAVRGRQDLYFSTKNHNFLITSKKIRCTSKYLTACAIFDSRLKYGI